jgi:hypothetical protein
MFSETRYALNGDLHVAYRASRKGQPDIVVVPTPVPPTPTHMAETGDPAG